VASMTRAVRLPVIVDCDEGYGDITNTYELVRQLASCGAAGVCIEDNAFPKVNSFYDQPGRALVTVEEFCARLDAVRSAAPQLFVMARTESLIAGLSLEEALERGDRYAEHGADSVVVHSRYTAFGEFRRLAQGWRGRVPLAVIPTLAEGTTWQQLREVGFELVIYANQALRAGVAAQELVLRNIREQGGPYAHASELATLDHLFDLTKLGQDFDDRRTGGP